MSEDEHIIVGEPEAVLPAGAVEGEEESVDGLPVLAEVRPIERVLPAPLPAVQAAAVAATSFVAGAATLALVKRHSARKLARMQRDLPVTRRPPFDLPPTGVRSQRYIVDVHWIARPGE